MFQGETNSPPPQTNKQKINNNDNNNLKKHNFVKIAGILLSKAHKIKPSIPIRDMAWHVSRIFHPRCQTATTTGFGY